MIASSSTGETNSDDFGKVADLPKRLFPKITPIGAVVDTAGGKTSAGTAPANPICVCTRDGSYEGIRRYWERQQRLSKVETRTFGTQTGANTCDKTTQTCKDTFEKCTQTNVSMAPESLRKADRVMLILAVVAIGWMAGRIMYADAVLVDGQCGAIDVTNVRRNHACVLQACSVVNCSIICPQSEPGNPDRPRNQCLAHWRDRWMGMSGIGCHNNTPIRTQTMTTLQWQVWNHTVLTLGGLHACQKTVAQTEFEKAPESVVMLFWKAFGEWRKDFRPEEIFTGLQLRIFQCLIWMYSTGVVTLGIYLIALMKAGYHGQAERLTDLMMMLPSVLFTRNGGMVCALFPWVGSENKAALTFLGLVLTYAPYLLIEVMCCLVVLTVVVIAVRCLSPREMKCDGVTVLEGPADMISNACLELVMTAVAALLIAASSQALGVAIVSMLMAVLGVLLILPPTPAEQTVMIQDGTGARHRVRVFPKRKQRFGPVYSAQARGATARIPWQTMVNAHRVTCNGLESTGFCMEGRFWVIKHAIVEGHDIVVDVDGVDVILDRRNAEHRVLDQYQSIIGYTPPIGMRSVKESNNKRTGWCAVVSTDATKKRTAQVFFATIEDGEIRGAYENEGGMSGSPMCDADGRIIGVHCGGVGDTGIGMVIPKKSPAPAEKSGKPKIEVKKVEVVEQKTKPTRKRISEANQHLTDIETHQLAIREKLGYLQQVKVWTDAEYNRLVESGRSSQSLREEARMILQRASVRDESAGEEQESDEYDSEGSDESWTYRKKTGEWSEDEGDYESQSKKKKTITRRASKKETKRNGDVEWRLAKLERMIEKLLTERTAEVKPGKSAPSAVKAKKNAAWYEEEKHLDKLDHPDWIHKPTKVVRFKFANPKEEKNYYDEQCYRNQRTKKQPVKAPCGEVTTSMYGHVKASGPTCGCSADTVPEAQEACKTHCVHYWCEEERRKNGITNCPGDNCRSDFCKLTLAKN